MSLNKTSNLHKIFPFVARLQDYDRSNLSKDFIAGLTVAVVLIPQVMAYAILAGLPPVHGLYAAFLGPQLRHFGEATAFFRPVPSHSFHSLSWPHSFL